jgi:hypothetical protein
MFPSAAMCMPIDQYFLFACFLSDMREPTGHSTSLAIHKT